MSTFFRTTFVELQKLLKRRIVLFLLAFILLISFAASGVNYYAMKVLIPRMNQEMEEFQKKQAEEGGSVTIEMGTMPGGDDTTYAERIEELQYVVDNFESLKSIDSPEFSDLQYRNSKDDLKKYEYMVEKGYVEGSDLLSISDSEKALEKMDMWATLSSTSLFMAIVFITLAIVLSLQVAGEFENGTMKAVLMNPGSRMTILLSKFSAIVIFAVLLQIFNYISHALAGLVFFGWGDPMAHVVRVMDGTVIDLPSFASSMLVYLVATWSLLMPLAFVLLLAVLTRSNAATIGISLLVYLFINSILGAFANNFNFLRFTPFLNMNIEDFITGGIPVNFMAFNTSSILNFAYLIIFMLAAIIIYKRRDV